MSKENVATRKGEAGFSLMELMIVLAILSVLAAVLVPNFQRHLQAARVGAAVSDLRCIQGALSQYELKNPDAPIPLDLSNYAAVAALSSDNGCWMPPDGDPLNPRRPWDPYLWACTIWISGHAQIVPCDALIPQPQGGQLSPQGYELFVRTRNVSPEYPGAVVSLSSDRGIHVYTAAQAQLQTAALHP